MKNNKLYPEFLEEFRVMLIRRYQWTVTEASQFNSEKLKQCLVEGLDKHQSYFRIFEIEPDLQS